MSAIFFSRKQRFQRGFRAGLIAGVLASGVMLLLNLTAGGVSLPDVLGSTLALAMPLPIFDYLHRTIGGDAKYYLFWIILIGQCFVFALSAGLYALATELTPLQRWRDTQGQLHWVHGLLLACLLWLFTGLLFLPLVGGGIFGVQLVVGAGNTMVSLAVVGLVFGLFFIFVYNWLVLRRLPTQGTNTADAWDDEHALQRRDIVRNGLVVLGLGALGILAWRFITNGSGGASQLSSQQVLQNYKDKVPPPTPDYGSFPQVAGLSPEVTSNDQYYVVSKNFLSDPTVNGATWNLTVNGLFKQSYTLNYQQLLALPMQSQYESMMCISNEVGGNYMSNALWEGVPLKDLLARAGGVRPGVTKIVLYAADGYSDSIHLTKALEPTTLVAVKMNGVTLPQGHGYPARLLVPGIYGMKHVKWITRIEAVNTDYQGYWQQSGWSDPAPIRMTSRIDTPLSGAQLSAGKPTYIAGVAFSGNKGISEVDVSFDAGATWNRAVLKKPLSDLTWVLWEIPWRPKAGTYSIVARAIDRAGDVQDPHSAAPLPDGSSGYHTITVTVK